MLFLLSLEDSSTKTMICVYRMLSNRESARRSRRRKQEHLTTLEEKVRDAMIHPRDTSLFQTSTTVVNDHTATCTQ